MSSHATVGPARRLAAAASLIALIAALTLTGPLTEPSYAADYEADSSASWEMAVANALANTGEANTITITDDFTFESASTPVYDLAAHDLMIDGGGHTVTASATNSVAFFDAYGGTGSLVVQNLALVGFESDSVSSLETAGYIYLNNVAVADFVGHHSAFLLNAPSITVYQSTFERNTSEGDSGGAIHAACADLDIGDSSFSGNVADGAGGAVYASTGCHVDLYESSFTDNASEEDGGAVFGDALVYAGDSEFTDNYAAGDGGAIDAGEAEAHSSTFTGNEAAGNGGAVASVDDTEAGNSTFASNRAGGDGGAIIIFDDSFVAYDSTFTNNSASNAGGAAWAWNYVDSHESTWTGNSAPYGGALYTDGLDYSSYLQSTFVANTATIAGGAVYAAANYVDVYSTTMTGNEAPDGAHVYVADNYIETFASVFDDGASGSGCYAHGGVDSIGYTFDDDGTCTDAWEGTGDMGDQGERPLLGPLAHNGGPTHTRHPLPGSPLIDAIPWVTCDNSVDEDNDQRGLLRIDTGADVDGCDVGSVEVLEIAFTIATDNGDVEVSVTNALDETCADWTSITGYTPTPPADVAFPFGVFDYCFTLPGDGWPVTIELDLPSPVNELWKVSDATWTEISGATIDGTTVTYSITDGDDLDEDATVNGEIIDPVAPGIGATFTG